MSLASHQRRGLARVLREPANAVTHFIGVVLAIIGTVALLISASGDPWRVVSVAIFGASMILLYSASTLLHAVHAGASTLRRLRVFDHAAIFVLIAGTYTPITLVPLRLVSPGWGWALFGTVWGLAVLGVVFKLFWINAPRWLSTALYVGLGWIVMIAVVPLVQALSLSALLWLAAGGLCYTVGAVVYATKWPDPWPQTFGFHALWHLFVLAGTACHFVMILVEVVLA